MRSTKTQLSFLTVIGTGLLLAGCQQPSQQVTHTSDAADAAQQEPNYSSKANPVVTVNAYYFHRTLRCPTCLSIERQAHDAIKREYARQTADGIVTWIPTNIDEPENSHFESEYNLTTSSLILVRLENDKTVRWENLDTVWELVDNRTKFANYVSAKMKDFLK